MMKASHSFKVQPEMSVILEMDRDEARRIVAKLKEAHLLPELSEVVDQQVRTLELADRRVKEAQYVPDADEE